jgi:NAD(P)-dependent dehydrogenase (short-subunit alcohol dehydrogenase family)
MAIFDGKVAVVTGGSSGIGRATAVAFARAGAKVVVASRSAHQGEQTVQLIKEVGSDGLFVRTDVVKEADVCAMVEKTVKAFGRLDFAFNNAGVDAENQALTEQSEETFDRIMSINVKGAWLCLKHEVTQMLRNGGGAIVNTTSVGDSIGFPGAAIYTASKHAVLGLTRAAALEYAKFGTRVNAVSPGTIDTEMFERFAGNNESLRAQVMAMHPMGRIGKPEELRTL